jgi:hypothetical protein
MSKSGTSRHFSAVRNLVAIGGIPDFGEWSARQIYGFTPLVLLTSRRRRKLPACAETSCVVSGQVAFRELERLDDRGTFIEPHSKHEFGVGTISVRQYLADIGEPTIEEGKFVGATVKTLGPKGNFGALVYIEKEGFMPLLDEVNLANRFDIAIMSNKGFSVTASRMLVDRMCSERGIPLFILHDFDKAGLGISATLHRSGRRYQFDNTVQVIDLGLRLAHVRALGLERSAEMAARDKGSPEKRAANMRRNGRLRKRSSSCWSAGSS